jgi:molybdenum cofactor biosynthesis protein B
MSATPHPDTSETSVRCAVMTVSDTRTIDTDKSGQRIQQLLKEAGHHIGAYAILKDEPDQIRSRLINLVQDSELDALIFNGGTGIAPRDTTYDVLESLLEKPIPGFGELFRWLSYQEIGSRAISSRATAGVFRDRLVFSLPGSTNAVTLAMEALILPELRHLVSQIRQP